MVGILAQKNSSQREQSCISSHSLNLPWIPQTSLYLNWLANLVSYGIFFAGNPIWQCNFCIILLFVAAAMIDYQRVNPYLSVGWKKVTHRPCQPRAFLSVRVRFHCEKDVICMSYVSVFVSRFLLLNFHFVWNWYDFSLSKSNCPSNYRFFLVKIDCSQYLFLL